MVFKYRIVCMKRLFLIVVYVFFSYWTVLRAQEISQLDLFQPMEAGLRDQQQLTELDMDIRQLQAAYRQGLADRIQFRLPLKEEALSFALQRVELFHPDFQLSNAHGEMLNIPTGRHYQAFQGDTLLTLSVFPHGVHAQMNTSAQSFTLAADPRQPSRYYWNRTSQRAPQLTGLCQTSDVIDADLQRSIQEVDQSVYTRSALPALSVYFEMDHYIYQEQGQQLETCLLLMAGIFNAVAQIYRLEGIGLQLRGLKVWDQPDAFSTEDAREALSSFRAYLPRTYTEAERDWDIALLLSRYTNSDGLAPHGGLANINSLCDIRRRQAYANIGSGYNGYPHYSWTVFVIAHEIGHTIASPHSHSCSWPEGPLDDCYCPEGACEPGPSAAERGGGTIMSYCYLQQPFSNFCPEFPAGENPGVNYLRAFGEYPGNLMRQRIREKACLQDRPVEQLPNLRVVTLERLTRINDTILVEGLEVQNTGTRAAALFRVGLFQGDDFVGVVPIQSLAAGGSLKVDFELLLPDTNWQTNFSFHLDIWQEVAEWHEGDNFYEQELTEQQDYPILLPKSDSVWLDTDYFFAFPGLALQNIGWVGSSSIDLRCYLEQSGERVLLLLQKSVSALAPTEKHHFSVAAYEPGLALPAGAYYLRIEIGEQGAWEVYRWPKPIAIRGAFWEWFRN